MHLTPAEGAPRPVGQAIVDLMFPPGENGRVPVVAITGVNGKTTTTRFIAHILKGTGRIVGLSLMGREKLQPVLEAELAALKELGVTEISPRSMGGSDHQSFEGKGVPGFMFRQDPAEYRLTHHSQSDTLDKARADDLVQGAQVMSVLAMRLANRDELLSREKPTPTPRSREGSKKDGG